MQTSWCLVFQVGAHSYQTMMNLFQAPHSAFNKTRLPPELRRVLSYRRLYFLYDLDYTRKLKD